jgi:hypothetical protein
MYFYLVQALKRRLVLELQDSFSKHPIYEKIVPFIQNRFAFTERPQMGIVVKGSSANKVQLSADNFLGSVESHVMLAYVGAPVYPIEWVREDLACLNANHGVMPTPPGIYYLEILSAPENAQSEGSFIVDPLLTVNDEAVLRFISGIENEAQLQRLPVQGTLRLWENRKFLLSEGTHYRVDYETGAIELLIRSAAGSVLTADYRYSVPSVGPVSYQWNRSDFTTLPGVVLAFGKRGKAGDKVAIVVYEDRVETAQAYGGRFDATFELDALARDPTQMEELADLIIMYLWGQKRSVLSSEGIEITDISMGGEAEEIYDETSDDSFYNASLSIQMQADWEIHIPLPLTVSRVTPTTALTDKSANPLDTQQATTIINDVQNKLFFATMPVIAGRNNNFERIL